MYAWFKEFPMLLREELFMLNINDIGVSSKFFHNFVNSGKSMTINMSHWFRFNTCVMMVFVMEVFAVLDFNTSYYN